MTDRAVSVTVNYALGLAVATLLLSGLLMATGDLLATQRESAIRAELDVVGQRVAAGLMTADRLAEAGGDEVTVSVPLPTRIGGSGYQIEVASTGSGSHLLLESHDPATSQNVSFANRTAVEPTTVTGGDLRIGLAPDGALEVEAA